MKWLMQIADGLENLERFMYRFFDFLLEVSTVMFVAMMWILFSEYLTIKFF